MITIKTQKRFSTSGGTFDTLKEAQESELNQVLEVVALADAAQSDFRRTLVRVLIEESDRVVDILTMTERSLPTARRINGASKPRKPKPASNSTTAQPHA